MSNGELEDLIALKKDNEYLKRSYKKLRNKYSNQYIAVKNEKVISHNKDMKFLMKIITDKNIDLATTLIEFLHPKDRVLIL